jgi:putative ABC transport system permease protein
MYQVALKMLMGDKAKYYGLIFGIVFATFLMAQQVSLFIGAMKRTASQIYDITEADVWVMRPEVEYAEEIRGLRDMDLYRIRSIQGVQWAVPLLKGTVMIQESHAEKYKQAILFGVDDTTLIGKPPKMILGYWEDLKMPDSLVIDWVGWKLIWGDEPYQLGRVVHVNDKRMVIVGICDTSAPFLTFPVVFTRYSTGLAVTSVRDRMPLSFVLARVKKGFNPNEVASHIEEVTGLQAMTHNEFAWRSIHYYLVNTAIPINFGITIALGFIIGAAIAGQTFYIFVIENLRQFAALKAIGVTNRQILSMVLVQAALVGFVGFSIGIGLSAIFFIFGTNVIALRGFYLPWEVALGTGISIVIIMILSSLVSIRKVLVLPPADVFKG